MSSLEAALGEHRQEAVQSASVLSSLGPRQRPGIRSFLRVTAVQQTALLFVGSLAYDAGSLACVPGWLWLARLLTMTPRMPTPVELSYLSDLLVAAIFFLFASSLFVMGLGLDVRQIKEQHAKARALPYACACQR